MAGACCWPKTCQLLPAAACWPGPSVAPGMPQWRCPSWRLLHTQSAVCLLAWTSRMAKGWSSRVVSVQLQRPWRLILQISLDAETSERYMPRAYCSCSCHPSCSTGCLLRDALLATINSSPGDILGWTVNLHLLLLLGSIPKGDELASGCWHAGCDLHKISFAPMCAAGFKPATPELPVAAKGEKSTATLVNPV